jgi:hypothetical protein
MPNLNFAEAFSFSNRGGVIMRGAELYRNFVPQSEDFLIPINRSYRAFKVELLCLRN